VSLIVCRVPGWSGQGSEMTSDALLPGGIDGGGRLCFWDVAEHVAQGRGTEAQRAAD
jgi:hypothetical protein